MGQCGGEMGGRQGEVADKASWRHSMWASGRGDRRGEAKV